MQRDIEKNAKTVAEIRDRLKIPLILNSGSLLGAYRDGAVIPGDEDDLDFAVPHRVAQTKFKQVVQSFLDEGFKIHRLRDTVASFKRGENHIDFLFYKSHPDGEHYYETLYHQKKPFALLVKKEYWDDLTTIEFLGQVWDRPRDTEGFLQQRYGKDWRTPIQRKDFGFQHFIERPGLTEWI